MTRRLGERKVPPGAWVLMTLGAVGVLTVLWYSLFGVFVSLPGDGLILPLLLHPAMMAAFALPLAGPAGRRFFALALFLLICDFAAFGWVWYALTYGDWLEF